MGPGPHCAPVVEGTRRPWARLCCIGKPLVFWGGLRLLLSWSIVCGVVIAGLRSYGRIVWGFGQDLGPLARLACGSGTVPVAGLAFLQRWAGARRRGVDDKRCGWIRGLGPAWGSLADVYSNRVRFLRSRAAPWVALPVFDLEASGSLLMD